MQPTPISPAERVRLSKQFAELMGGAAPKNIDEALKYELAKERFINERSNATLQASPLLAERKLRPKLADILGKGVLPPTPPEEVSSGFGGFFKSTPIAPETHENKWVNAFEGMPAPAQKPPAMAPQGGPTMPSAGMGGGASTNPTMNGAYLKQMQDMVAQQLTAPQEAAAKTNLEALKRAQAEYNAATGGGESALDFYRKSMEGVKRPDRKDVKLSDADRNDMLMRFGLGMLKNNRRGFGEAFGAAGTDAIDFGDRVKERSFTDALEVYRDAMTRLNTEVNLSQKDKDALRERAATSYAQAKEIANAEAGVTLSGTAGAQANINALTKSYEESEKARREAMQNATSRDVARISASASSAKGVPTEGLTAEGYARLSTQARKQAEDIRGMLPKKDDPRYNALATQADQLEKQANMYWTASTRAAGGR